MREVEIDETQRAIAESRNTLQQARGGRAERRLQQRIAAREERKERKRTLRETNRGV